MSPRFHGKKIGQNDPCPCGSGKKYKRCHGALARDAPSTGRQTVPESVRQEIERLRSYYQAAEHQRQDQQGYGRPIISTLHEGSRFVAVGTQLFWSPKWKTFHDFLFWYIKKVLGSDGWGTLEIKKPFEQRHPLIQWYDHLCRYQREFIKVPGQVHSAAMTGAVRAYLNLAYYLYLLGHNTKDISTRLIRRLKDPRDFRGAYYETYVASVFIHAGFELEFENEDDRSTTHCEFTATAPRTCRKFSVEAKARHHGLSNDSQATTPSNPTLRVGRQLARALKKQARHIRAVFIDANVPDEALGTELGKWMNTALYGIRRLETLRIKDKPADSAYVFITNHPYTYDLHGTEFRASAVVEGFKIPEFKGDAKFSSMREAAEVRERHREMFDLMESMKRHHEIPSTFDGDSPELAYSDNSMPRLIIGQKYLVPNGQGLEVPGVLEDAVVLEEGPDAAYAHGIFLLESGKRVIVKGPLSAAELRAYKQHPDTFFGVVKRVSRKLTKAMDFYDFFYESNRHMAKDRLLDLMKGRPNFAELQSRSQEDLAKLYSEALAQSAYAQAEAAKRAKTKHKTE